ncbi:hypothetical protein ACOTTU_20995 [Roseobacter sp. EG26]|uniref:hypothetical protein n=1 Tax=Roseobacter sp. EG26 TaxID=3412477 RepID=UPI003CE59B7E
MSIEAIFGLQLGFSLLVVALIARAYVAPWLSTLSLHSALAVLVIPHMFRHVGMSFQVPGLVGADIPGDFAAAAAYGDLASAALAVIAFLLLRARAAVAIALVWVLNLVGFFGLLNALRQAEAIPQLGVTWYIPTFIVPVLLVTQIMMFVLLARALRSNRNCERQVPAE